MERLDCTFVLFLWACISEVIVGEPVVECPDGTDIIVVSKNSNIPNER